MCAEGLTRRRTVPICIQNNIQNKSNEIGGVKKKGSYKKNGTNKNGNWNMILQIWKFDFMYLYSTVCLSVYFAVL